MALYEIGLGSSQDGWSGPAGWTEGTTYLPVLAGDFDFRIGLVFDTAGLNIYSATLRLVLEASTQTPPNAGFGLFWVPETAPANYSGSLLPFTRSEVRVCDAKIVAPTPGDVVEFTLGATYLPSNQATIDASMAQFASVVASPSWSSRLAFSLHNKAPSLMRFESSDHPTGTPPTLETVETVPEEFESMAHVAKLVRSVLKAKLNADPAIQAIAGLQFSQLPGRALQALESAGFAGYIATHPEQAIDRTGSVRELEVTIFIVSGSTDAGSNADQLDDAQEAVEIAIGRDPTLGNLVGDMRFVSATPAIDATGQRHYGSRAIAYAAPFTVNV